MPDFQVEREFLKRGASLIAGVDEAGRGCLFGPVVAAAVILPPSFILASELPRWVEETNDSKLLSPSKRRRLARDILRYAEAVGLGVVSNREIDAWNIYQASLEAMKRAVAALSVSPDVVLVDGFPLKDVQYSQMPLKRGDRKSVSIAAASIVAKVFRDSMVGRLSRVFEGFGLERNKGYGTREHREALQRQGQTPLHRASFRLREEGRRG